MIVKSPAGEQRVLLQGISWETYERLVNELEDRAGIRMAYLRGSLELMSPSQSHESIKKLLARLVEAYTVEAGIPIKSAGSTTFKREDLERGLEPDECYWVTNEQRVRPKPEVDLLVDPPPDLAIEVEITRSSVPKLEIYAGLGIPEVWRHDGEALTILRLGADGKYSPIERSAELPALPPAEVTRAIERRETGVDENSLIREFARRVRDGFPGA